MRRRREGCRGHSTTSTEAAEVAGPRKTIVWGKSEVGPRDKKKLINQVEAVGSVLQ